MHLPLCPPNECFCCVVSVLWVIVLLHDKASSDQFGCIFVYIARQNGSANIRIHSAATIMSEISHKKQRSSNASPSQDTASTMYHIVFSHGLLTFVANEWFLSCGTTSIFQRWIITLSPLFWEGWQQCQCLLILFCFFTIFLTLTAVATHEPTCSKFVAQYNSSFFLFTDPFEKKMQWLHLDFVQWVLLILPLLSASQWSSYFLNFSLKINK